MCKDCPLKNNNTNTKDLIGYNPIEKIRGALYFWLPVPFNGVEIWMKLRCLRATQLKSCGDISQINFRKEDNKEISLDDLISTKNTQEAIARESLVFPSFDEVIKVITEEDFLIADKKRELEEIKLLLEKAPNKAEKRKLQKRIDGLDLQIGIIIPDDMLSFITAWAIGVDITDIKKISRKMLLEAAILAKNGNDNPSDHMRGVFTDLQREDINRCSWIIYNEFQEEKKMEKERKNSGFKWIGGKKK